MTRAYLVFGAAGAWIVDASGPHYAASKVRRGRGMRVELDNERLAAVAESRVLIVGNEIRALAPFPGQLALDDPVD